MSAYYNEIEPYAADWLRNLIAEGLIPSGVVDTRSIVDVQPSDLAGFTQCHFFAGIGGWAYAARLAGWPDDRPLWTGSCPCQPFSVAGKQLGTDDPRHLWPHFFRLIRACRPPVVMGEQVAGAAGYGWLDGVVADLAGEDYACRGVDIPACSVDAPHIRSRLYWVAKALDDATGARRAGAPGPDPLGTARDEARGPGSAGRGGYGRTVADTHGAAGQQDPRGASRDEEADGRAGRDRGQPDGDHRPPGHGESTGGYLGNASSAERGQQRGEPREQESARLGRDQSRRGGQRNGTFWSDTVWLTGADGKARRAQPGLPLLAHGVPARVGRLRAYGNAIVPQLAAEVIAALLDDECVRLMGVFG